MIYSDGLRYSEMRSIRTGAERETNRHGPFAGRFALGRDGFEVVLLEKRRVCYSVWGSLC